MISQSQRPIRSHGGVRGDDLDRRSSQSEGLFGRIFRTLPAAAWSENALIELAGDGKTDDRLTAPPETDESTKPLPKAPSEIVDENNKPRTSRLHDDEENPDIDAGYTYLGQFIDHDLTFDPTSSLQKQNDVNALVDFRTPRFDLDSVYGHGPDDQPYMYDISGRYFQIGSRLTDGIGGKTIAHDLPRHTWKDRNGKVYNRALIGDKRNDENVIISQLHGIFLKFHNRFALENPQLSFSEVQRQVRWHYQYVVIHDFLYKIARKDVIESILPHLCSNKSIFENSPKLLFYKPKNEAFMPVEFSAAAYRFGHSMVRPIYRLNTKLKGGDDPVQATQQEIARGVDGRQFIFAGIAGRGLNGFDKFPKEWGIDWNLFFDLTGDKNDRVAANRTQPSYKIDTSLVNPLAFLPEFSIIDKSAPLDDIDKLKAKAVPGQIPNLALRNLLRGMSMSLPSGQDVALAMGLTPLTDNELKIGKATTSAEYKDLPLLISLALNKEGRSEFEGKAPLWYYVLAEAQHEWHKKNGEADTTVQLGKVGSRIITETFVGIMLSDSHSILRQAPAWAPEIGKKELFDMTDFIKYALNLKITVSV